MAVELLHNAMLSLTYNSRFCARLYRSFLLCSPHRLQLPFILHSHLFIYHHKVTFYVECSESLPNRHVFQESVGGLWTSEFVAVTSLLLNFVHSPLTVVGFDLFWTMDCFFLQSTYDTVFVTILI